jgi:UDP:flavonoid glycosyltransferase YjiC (YdhE family)
MRSAVDEWRPDLVLREPCEFASAITAERNGIPHAQVAISLARIEASSLALAAPVLEPHGAGLATRLQASAYLTRFPASLDPSPFPVTRRFFDAYAGQPAPLPDWWPGSDVPLVYVTFGTVTGELPEAATVYRDALAAVGRLDVRVLLTIGRGTDPATLGALPGNVHVEEWVPQRDVLATATAVVCHGGSGTTYGALAAGVPVVAVPRFADQPTNARLVEEAGAGLVAEPEAPRIRAALERILAEPSFSHAARTIAAEMGSAPTIDELLTDLEPTR